MSTSSTCPNPFPFLILLFLGIVAPFEATALASTFEGSFPLSLFRESKKGRCGELTRISQKIGPTHPWRDWSLYLQASCITQKKIQSPADISLARSALEELELHHVHSPLRSEVTQLISRIDLQAAGRTQTPLDLRRLYFRRAIDRWVNEKKMGLITLEDLRTFSQICGPLGGSKNKKSPDTSCLMTARHLLQAAPKNSPEEKRLLEGLHLKIRDDLSLPAAEPFERLSKPYRDADPDQRSIEAALEQFKNGDIAGAKSLLEKTLIDFPKSTSRTRILHWLAKIEEQQNHMDEAQNRRIEILKKSPFTWYGLYSALKMNKVPGEVISSLVPESTTEDPRFQMHEARTTQRTQALLKQGFIREAALEATALKARDALSSRILLHWSDLAHQSGAHHVAFPLITELIQRGNPEAHTTSVLHRIFPVPLADFWATLEEHAKANEIDPLWVLSLIKQESAFHEHALSSVGATGFMQLMPATALEVLPGVTRSETRTRDINIRAGTRYLGWMLKKYQGSVPHALAAYNAGPAAVDRWLKEGRDPGNLEGWIESIPYRETRDYVGSILRNRWWYTHRIEGRNLSWADIQNFYRPNHSPGSTQ